MHIKLQIATYIRRCCMHSTTASQHQRYTNLHLYSGKSLDTPHLYSGKSLELFWYFYIGKSVNICEFCSMQKMSRFNNSLLLQMQWPFAPKQSFKAQGQQEIPSPTHDSAYKHEHKTMTQLSCRRISKASDKKICTRHVSGHGTDSGAQRPTAPRCTMRIKTCGLFKDLNRPGSMGPSPNEFQPAGTCL